MPAGQRPPRSPLSISVFFPCYNEEANVVRTTESALQALRRISGDFEIIIVNDGSRDRTGEIADRLAQEHSEVRAVHNNPNLGYGGALQRGFREARKPWVFYTDGDGQFDFEEIGRLLPLLEQFDIVSAYRINRQDSLMRKVNALCWTALVNCVFRLWLRDIDCAFKIYPRALFDEIEMRSMGALIDTEILARAKRLGYTVGQIGVQHYPRVAGTQTGANFRVILRAFKELFLLRRDIRRTSGATLSTGNIQARAEALQRELLIRGLTGPADHIGRITSQRGGCGLDVSALRELLGALAQDAPNIPPTTLRMVSDLLRDLDRTDD